MAKVWYQDIIDTIEKYLNTDLPVQIVHFPSTGVTSALNKYRGKDNNDLLFFIIDFRVFHFDENTDKNQAELLRVIQEHIEQQVSEPIKHDHHHLPYRQLELLFKKYAQQGKKVVVNLQNILLTRAIEVKGFQDFLIFLDRLRDETNGNINILISTAFSLTDAGYSLPIPLITKHFNYYRTAGLEESISNSILQQSVFKTHTKQDVEYLIDLSGGLAVLIKALVRDLTLKDSNLSDIDNLIFNDIFFEEYPNVKYSLDRIFQQLHSSTISTLIRLVNKQDISKYVREKKYLSKVGLIDKEDNLKGIILPAYIEEFYPSEVKSIHPQETIDDSPRTEGSKLISITNTLQIHSVSGEIYQHKKSNGKYFSEKEFEIFSFLLKHKNETVTRDDIADILWRDDADKLYSDWAIDKTISRIREKIEDEKPYKVIKTLRGKGFLLVI